MIRRESSVFQLFLYKNYLQKNYLLDTCYIMSTETKNMTVSWVPAISNISNTAFLS